MLFPGDPRLSINHPRLKRAVDHFGSGLALLTKLGELYSAWQVHPVGSSIFLPKAA